MKSRFGMTIATLAAVIASFPASAAESARQSPATDASKRQETPEKMKERVLQHIDARIQILQRAKSCVQAANNMASVAVCHAQERKQTKNLRDKDRREIRRESPAPQTGSAPR